MISKPKVTKENRSFVLKDRSVYSMQLCFSNYCRWYSITIRGKPLVPTSARVRLSIVI